MIPTHVCASYEIEPLGNGVERRELFLWRFVRGCSALLNAVLHFAGGDLLPRYSASLASVGFNQRRRSAGNLARPAGGHQNVTVIAVKSIHQLHNLYLLSVAVGGGTMISK